MIRRRGKRSTTDLAAFFALFALECGGFSRHGAHSY
jgi:hypothetical protein